MQNHPFSFHHRDSGEHNFGLHWRAHMRAKRGDIAPIILHLLQEKSMHGYEIIRTLEEKSHGFWRPSAGSIYPVLQLLEEQELITGRDENGKRVYDITEKGKIEATKTQPHCHPWDMRDKKAAFHRLADLRGMAPRLMTTIRTIGLHGSDSDIQKLKKLLEDFEQSLATLAHEVDKQK